MQLRYRRLETAAPRLYGTAAAPETNVHLSIYRLVLQTAIPVPLRRRTVNSRTGA
ncbi:unnamed protein product [Callosobruchus maculatus]|uniref:Uncharacterized protein n=1 Tax=Callosobruchus maculatus TaxID=64391 RepID=A0A653DS60_CALMS|nr:unnamed protein product [Callosobruchus maculatus]